MIPEGFALVQIPDPDKDQRDEVLVQFPAVHGICHGGQEPVHIFHGLWNTFLRAGILEVQDDRSESWHGIIDDLFQKIFKAGHVHGSAQAVLQEFPVRIFIKVFRLHDKGEIRIVTLMSHSRLMFSFLIIYTFEYTFKYTFEYTFKYIFEYTCR